MNLKKFTYQGILFILGGLLLILILAAINLQPLISAAWNSHSLLKEQSNLIEHADRILLSQSKELKQLEKVSAGLEIGDKSLDLSNSVDFGLYLQGLCKKYKLRLISLPKEKEEIVSGYKALESNFSLEGKLSDLLSLTYELEHSTRIGSITGLSLKKEILRVSGKKQKVLTASLTLKRLIEI